MKGRWKPGYRSFYQSMNEAGTKLKLRPNLRVKQSGTRSGKNSRVSVACKTPLNRHGIVIAAIFSVHRAADVIMIMSRFAVSGRQVWAKQIKSQRYFEISILFVIFIVIVINKYLQSL